MPTEVKRPRQLQEENVKLKRLVADLSLDKASFWMYCRRLIKNKRPGFARSASGYRRELLTEAMPPREKIART